jgi:hypothetical protein
MDFDKNNNEPGHDKSCDDNCVVRQKDETVSLDQMQQQPANDDTNTSRKNSADQDPEEGESKNNRYSQNETLATKKTPPPTFKDPPQVSATTSESSATEEEKASATSGTIHCPVQGCPQEFSVEKYLRDHIAQTKGKAHKKYRQQQAALGSGVGKDEDDDDDSSNKQGEKRPLPDKQEGDDIPPAQKKACAPLVYRKNLHEPFGFGRRY